MVKILPAIAFIVFLVGSIGRVSAQFRYQNFEKGKVKLTDKSRIKLSNVYLNDSTFTAQNAKTSEAISMAYEDVKILKVQGENRLMWEGFALGAVSAIGLTAAIVLVEGDPLNLENYTVGLTRLVPFMAVMGGMIGVTFKRYDLVPYEKWQPEALTLQHQSGYGLGLTLAF